MSYASSHLAEEVAARFSPTHRNLSRRGYQTYTLAALRPLVVTNAHRRDLWFKLIAFLSWPIMAAKFSQLYVDGGFASSKESPNDVDIVLQTREAYGPAAFKAIEPFFAVGLDSILATFNVHVHFWMENAPPGIVDFRAFFLRRHRPRFHTSQDPANPQFRVALDAPDILDCLRRELEFATQSKCQPTPGEVG